MRMSQRDIQIMAQRNPKLCALYPGIFAPNSKPAKYRNTKVYIYEDGFASFGEKLHTHGKVVDVFDSEKEYERFHQLRLLEKAGKIKRLERQVNMVIQEASEYRGQPVRAIVYKADFQYTRDERTVVEDVKPFDKKSGRHRLTKDFSLKWKMLKLRYPHIIFEIY